MTGVIVTAETVREVIETDSGTIVVETPLIGPQGPPSPPSGAAGGVLNGSYPNPSFAADMATQAELDAGLAAKQDAATAATDQELLNSIAAHAAAAGAHAISGVAGLQAALDARQLLSGRNQANGYAGLDGSGKVDALALPALAITSRFVVASQAAQLALSAQEGDVAIRTDLSRSYIHNGGTAGTMADWSELLTPDDAVSSVAGKTGVVALIKGDVGLGNADNTADAAKPVSTAQQAALDAKQASSAKGAASGYMGLDASSRGAQSPKLHSADHSKGSADAIALGAIAPVIGDVPVALVDALMPWRHEVFGALAADSAVAKTGTWAQTFSSAYVGWAAFYNSSNAVNDAISWDLALAAGTYSLYAWIVKNPAYGISTVKLDGTTLGTFDHYAAATANNTLASITGIAVATTGKKRLSFNALSKNAASTGYYLMTQNFALVRTA